MSCGTCPKSGQETAQTAALSGGQVLLEWALGGQHQVLQPYQAAAQAATRFSTGWTSPPVAWGRQAIRAQRVQEWATAEAAAAQSLRRSRADDTMPAFWRPLAGQVLPATVAGLLARGRRAEQGWAPEREQAAALYAQALEQARTGGDPAGATRALLALGQLAVVEKDLPRARDYFGQAGELTKERDDAHFIG